MRNEVREARLEAGLSQAELARRAGVPRMQVVAIEGGRNVPLPVFEKVITQLPGLELRLSQVEVALSAGDQQKNDQQKNEEENAAEWAEYPAIVKRLFYPLGGLLIGDGDPRFEDQPPIDPKKIRELEDILERILRGEEPVYEFHPRPRLRLVKKKK